MKIEVGKLFAFFFISSEWEGYRDAQSWFELRKEKKKRWN